MDYPKVLLISHNCLSKSGSNGRTLSNFFRNWPIGCLAQFYIHNEIPDSKVCNNYFRVLDVEALKALIKGIKVGGKIYPCKKKNDRNNYKSLNSFYGKYCRNNSVSYIFRNIIWNSGRWKGNEFTEWVNKFSPNVVLFQAGDYEFMYKIAIDIAKQSKIPLVIYNSEDYYFKDRFSFSPFFHFYRYKYKKQFENTIAYASNTIYNSKMLQETYNKRFNHKSNVIMTSTEIVPLQNKKENYPPIISYLGNLGVGRHVPLIEIANALRQVDSNLYLDVYGQITDETVKSKLERCEGIRYKGVVSYKDASKIIKNSDLLVHAENFSKFYQSDLKHAFSTKIADSLASGVPFLLYAPENMACTKYLNKNKAACVVSEKEDLIYKIDNIILDLSTRKRIVDIAKQIVLKNHDIANNSEKFLILMRSTIEKKGQLFYGYSLKI